MFERNEGQLPAGVDFLARTSQYSVAVSGDGLRFLLPGSAPNTPISILFENSSRSVPKGLEEASFRTNFYVGTDPSQWRTGVRNYRRIGLAQIYPGINSQLYASQDRLEHDFDVAPGADAGVIAMRLVGARSASVDASGDVLLNVVQGELRLRKPVAFQVLPNGTHKPVDASFDLVSHGETADLQFKIGTYDHTRELVIDPVIVYSTFAAGTLGSTASSVASDSLGNVYLSGTTTSANFAGLAPTTNCGSAPCANNVFVVMFKSGSEGSAPAWLTYLGDSGTQSTVVTSSVANGSNLFLGGYTNEAALASGATTSVSNPTGGYVGFVSGLSTATGALAGTNFIYADATHANNVSVEALALDNANNLYLTGAIGTTTTSSLVLNPNGNAFAVAPIVTAPYTSLAAPQPGNAYVAEYLAATPFSATPAFFTYIQANTLATAIAVDSNNLIYVAGQTMFGFSSPPALSAESNSGTGSKNDAFELNFSINPTPAPPTVSAFTWIDAMADTTVASLGIDGAGNSYLFGKTLANNLGVALSAGASACALQCTLPDINGSGYAVELSSAGTTLAYTYLGGSGATDTVTAGTFASGSAYIVGQTDAPAVAAAGSVPFAATPTAQPGAGTTALPAIQDNTVGGTKRGYLVSLSPGLASVNYVANVGGPGGGDTAVAVALDGATPNPNAYVAANIASGSTPYTPYAAWEATTPATSGSSAYVAEIAASNSPYGLTVVAAAGSPTPDPVGYAAGPPAVASSVTYTWNVNASSVALATNVVVAIASTTGLTYSSAQVSDITSGANAGSLGICAVGTTGISCVIPSMLQTVSEVNDTWSVVLNAVTNGSLPPGPAQISVTATAVSPASETQTATQKSNIAGIPALTLSVIASTPGMPPPPGIAGTVNAALPADTCAAGTPNTCVTYTYTITNTSAYDSPSTTLNLSLGSLTYGFTMIGGPTITPAGGSATPPTCDPTLAAGCDIPKGQTLVYSVSGVYPASDFGSTSTGPFTSKFGTAPSASFKSPVLNPQPVFVATFPVTPLNPTNPLNGSVTIQGNAALSATITTSSSTYNGGFQLGDPGVHLMVTVTNSGPNPVGPGNVTVTLPKGFTVTTPDSHCTPPGLPPATVTCTFTSIPGGGGTTSPPFTFIGTFNDTGLSTDAVAPPLTTGGTPATVLGSATNGVVTVTVPAGGITLTGSGTYVPPSPAVTKSITVYRVNTLSYSISAAPNTVNETNTLDKNDSVTYTLTLSNTGPSVARGILFTVPIASAATVSSLVVSCPPPPPTQPALVCPTTYTLGATQLTFYTADLSGVMTSTNPVQVYPVTITVKYNEMTVPLTQANGMVPVVQNAGTFYAAAVANPAPATYSAGVVSSSSAPITVQRSSNLVQSLSVARVGAAPVTFADKTDINLDEHLAANAPGVNDTLTFTSTTYNLGPNDAAGVSIKIPLPKYLLVINYPATCSINGVSGINTLINTGATGATMVCTPPASSTPASATATGQVAYCPSASAGVCTGSTSTSTIFDGKTFVVSFTAKFADSSDPTQTVAQTNPTGVEAFSPATAAGNDVDTGANLVSSTPAPITVQRASHVALTLLPVPVYTNSTALSVDSTGRAQVGQAAPLETVATQTPTTGEVYNCLRYIPTWTNSGPNYAINTKFGYVISLPYVEAPATNMTTPVNCAGATPVGTAEAGSAGQTANVGAANGSNLFIGYPGAPAGNIASANLDGYFDKGAIGTANFAPAVFMTTGVAGAYNDSNTVATSAKDYAGSQTVTVVNTPYIDSTVGGSGVGFGVTPVGSTPQVTLAFTSVIAPGITSSSVSSSSTGITMPQGKSPYPPDGGVNKTLYQPGKTPNFYDVPTTANIPTASTNPTTICVTQASGLPDVFVKPERALMWVLQNPTGATGPGTGYGTVPNITSAATYGSGDITYSVTPAGGGSYPAPPIPPYTLPASTPLQLPKAQPAQVCGKVNGLPLSAGTSLSPAPAPTGSSLFAVLEPINFPPYINANYTAVSGSAGKGASSQSNNVNLVDGGPNATHDFNDNDPCYGGSITNRTKCDDNPYLNAWVFGGGNIQGAAQVTGPVPVPAGPISASSPVTTLPLGTFNLPVGSPQVYVVVADQTIWADSYAGSPLFTHEGNFLTGPASPGVFPVCDAGIASANYSLSAKACTATPPSLAQTSGYPLQTYVPGAGTGRSATYAIGNVGAAELTGSGSGSNSGTGLTPLPTPLNPTLASPPNPTNPAGVSQIAVVTITAGQTASFAWNWLGGEPESGTYTLSCVMVDAATQTTATPLPAGMSCNIPASYTFGSAAPPSIYVVTTGTLNAEVKMPQWPKSLGGALVAALLPFFIFCRKSKHRPQLTLLGVILLLAGAISLSGCGSGFVSRAPTVTPAGMYYFRATASQSGSPTLTTAPFEVVVLAGD